MKCLPLLVAILFHVTQGNDLSGRALETAKTAYCACACCEKTHTKCYRHPSIEEGFSCVAIKCTDDFCSQWHKIKCATSCFCSKCKPVLPASSRRCILYDGVAPGCECGDLTEVKCDEINPEEHEEIAEAMKKYRSMKKRNHCLIPCLCTKCSHKLPGHLQQDCEKAKTVPDDCSCQDTTCPSEEDLVVLNRLHEENEEMTEMARRLLEEARLEEQDEELSSINERLRPAIRSGRASPVSMRKLKETKCKLQCFCDKCGHDSPEMETTCRKMVIERVGDCPPCGEEVTCPAANNSNACVMACFCRQCQSDERMSEALKKKCGEMTVEDGRKCSCDETVDCSILNQVNLFEKKNKPSNTSIDDEQTFSKTESKISDEL